MAIVTFKQLNYSVKQPVVIYLTPDNSNVTIEIYNVKIISISKNLCCCAFVKKHQ